jgi:hypothetical protein
LCVSNPLAIQRRAVDSVQLSIGRFLSRSIRHIHRHLPTIYIIFHSICS